MKIRLVIMVCVRGTYQAINFRYRFVKGPQDRICFKYLQTFGHGSSIFEFDSSRVVNWFQNMRRTYLQKSLKVKRIFFTFWNRSSIKSMYCVCFYYHLFWLFFKQPKISSLLVYIIYIYFVELNKKILECDISLW